MECVCVCRATSNDRDAREYTSAHHDRSALRNHPLCSAFMMCVQSLSWQMIVSHKKTALQNEAGCSRTCV
jgi:hypothetical protein